MKQIPIALLLLITITIGCRAQTAEEKLRQKLDTISRQDGLVGFGVSVFDRDTILYQDGFGYADLEKKRPYTAATVQNIGSVSKTFTGVALMKMVEMGKLTMDTPINTLLPFKVVHPKYPDQEITIRHLATHTSGITDLEKTYDKIYVIENPEQVEPKRYKRPIAKYMGQLLKNKWMDLEVYLKAYLTPTGRFYKKRNFLRTAPGERYAYSNIATALAAYCVERVSGKPFDVFTKEHIFDKLGMEDAGWFLGSVPDEHYAKIYSDNRHVLPRYDLITYPDGGLRTNVTTLTLFMQEMMKCHKGRGSLLSPTACQEMMRGQLTSAQLGTEKEKETEDNYGFYWEHNNNNTIGHNGADPGILTLMYFYEDIELGAIFFTNTNAIDNPSAVRQVQKCWKAIRAYQKEIAK